MKDRGTYLLPLYERRFPTLLCRQTPEVIKPEVKLVRSYELQYQFICATCSHQSPPVLNSFILFRCCLCLQITILQGAKMLEKFYVERIFPLLNMTEEEFWERKLLELRDWRGKKKKKMNKRIKIPVLHYGDNTCIENFYRRVL